MGRPATDSNSGSGIGAGSTDRSDPAAVRFEPGFAARVERLSARLRAARGREGGLGRGADPGSGDEFVGHRPYRAGEELRHLDWSLLARSERAFVRVFRREPAQRWVILLDTSASMGLGRPAKLQRAVEVAAALAFAGLSAGVRSTLLGPGLRLEARAPGDLRAWIERLERLRAEGRAGLGELLRDPAAMRALSRAERLFLVGDLLDLDPAQVLPLAAAGGARGASRELRLVRLLAPTELDGEFGGAPGEPGAAASVRWVDPETGERLGVERSAEVRARYRRALRARLDAWDRLARGRGRSHGVWSTEAEFEDVVRSVLPELAAGSASSARGRVLAP